MIEIIFWLYFANTILVLIHELQGTYVKEWYYFKPPKKYSETTLLPESQCTSKMEISCASISENSSTSKLVNKHA